jgi:hypothetical protein
LFTLLSNSLCGFLSSFVFFHMLLFWQIVSTFFYAFVNLVLHFFFSSNTSNSSHWGFLHFYEHLLSLPLVFFCLICFNVLCVHFQDIFLLHSLCTIGQYFWHVFSMVFVISFMTTILGACTMTIVCNCFYLIFLPPSIYISICFVICFIYIYT